MATGAYTMRSRAERDGRCQGHRQSDVPAGCSPRSWCTAALGAVIGLAAARLRGPYLAGLTLAWRRGARITSAFDERVQQRPGPVGGRRPVPPRSGDFPSSAGRPGSRLAAAPCSPLLLLANLVAAGSAATCGRSATTRWPPGWPASTSPVPRCSRSWSARPAPASAAPCSRCSRRVVAPARSRSPCRCSCDGHRDRRPGQPGRRARWARSCWWCCRPDPLDSPTSTLPRGRAAARGQPPAGRLRPHPDRRHARRPGGLAACARHPPSAAAGPRHPNPALRRTTHTTRKEATMSRTRPRAASRLWSPHPPCSSRSPAAARPATAAAPTTTSPA